MPVQRCTENGKPGWKWGKSGKCYTYEAGNDKASDKAKQKAHIQGAAIEKAGYKENTMLFQSIITNFTGTIRHDTMEGKEYLVAPMIMITEGVHVGSNGALYYPKEELSKTPAVWNHKPVVVYHPQANGVNVSACDPVILTNRKIGVIMNTKYEEGKLKAEAWLDPERMKKVDDRILDSIEKNQMMELSTGVYTDNESEEGDWNGEHYDAIARNYRPDHLALLPDLIGACSIEDGAGFLRLNEKNGVLTLDVDGLEKEQRIYLRENKEDIVKQLSNLIVSILGKKDDDINKSRKENEMDKEKFIEDLIKNESTQWTDDDKETLMEMEEEVLEKMTPVKNEAEENKEENKDKSKSDEKSSENEDSKSEEKKGEEEEEQVENMTADDYISKKVPNALKGVFRSGLASYNATKDRLIDVITLNEKNTFTKEQLEVKDLDELKSLASLAVHTEEQEEKMETLNYVGQGDPTKNETEEEPMDVPVLNFGSEKK